MDKAFFIGSKSFGLNILKKIFSVSKNIKWTIIHPNDFNQSTSVYEEFLLFCKEKDLDILVCNSVSALTEMVKDFKPDIAIVSGYYQIIPESTLTLVPEGFWGFHNSLLPKYRGGSPLVWQIINGEEIIGSSFFKLGKGMDDGEILHQITIKNNKNYHIKDIINILSGIWEECLPEKFHQLINKTAELKKQDNAEASYCSQRRESDGEIDWSISAYHIDNFIKAQSSPYPGAFTIIDNQKVKILRHSVFEFPLYGSPGKLFQKTSSGVIICCGDSTGLVLKELSVDGVKYQSFDFFEEHKVIKLSH